MERMEALERERTERKVAVSSEVCMTGCFILEYFLKMAREAGRKKAKRGNHRRFKLKLWILSMEQLRNFDW